MGFSFNFTKVTRGLDGDREVLFVEGTSDDTKAKLAELRINLAEPSVTRAPTDGVIALPGHDRLQPVPVEDVRGERDWLVIYADRALPEVDEWVFVVGEALHADAQPPFVWAQTLQVAAQ